VLGLVFAGSVFFQIQTLCIFCRCWKSAWEVSQCNAALVFDGLVLGRIALSLVFRERNQKWIVWSVMSALSPLYRTIRENLLATVAAARPFPAAIAELGR
jgi:hypothetical protein